MTEREREEDGASLSKGEQTFWGACREREAQPLQSLHMHACADFLNSIMRTSTTRNRHIAKSTRAASCVCVFFFSGHPGVDIESWTSHGTDDSGVCQSICSARSRGTDDSYIITYIYWILAHKDVNTVFTRARARASRKIRGTGSRGRVVVPLRKMIIFGGDIETTTFFSFILSPNRGNPSLQDRLVREYSYIHSKHQSLLLLLFRSHIGTRR